MEPRLLILTDPRTDHQPIMEASYVNLPTIAFCHTDSPLNHIDIAIPCNNRGKHAIGYMWYLLTREVLYLRNTISRGQPWDIMADLFFYRDPEETDQQEERPALEQGQAGEDVPAEATWGEQGQQEWGTSAPGQEWRADQAPQGSWDQTAAPSTSWDAAGEQ